MPKHPAAHFLFYGDPGSGKSTAAASLPRPMIVFAFDPRGKDAPYHKRGNHIEEHESEHCPYVEIRDDKERLIRIEYYHDPQPESPTAWSRFRSRLLDVSDVAWRTIVFDSCTFMELSARKYDEYVENRGARDKRQHYGASKEGIEEVCLMRVAGYRCNVVTIAHVDEAKDELHGTFIRSPAFPGKLSKRAGAAYGEMYRFYVDVDNDGSREYRVQTLSDRGYNAATQIGAPDRCAPTYQSFWSGTA